MGLMVGKPPLKLLKTSIQNNNKIIDDKVSTLTNSIINTTLSSDTPLSEYIKVYDNVLDISDCNVILDEYSRANEWARALVGTGEISEERKCDSIFISSQSVLEKNVNTRKEIDSMLHQRVVNIIKKYVADFPLCDLSSDSGYDLLRYEVGGDFGKHVDSCTEAMRTVSISINLNDDYVGGEMAFFNREIQIKGGIGSAIVFPSNFMYPHEIMPVEKGTRYSIVTWLI